MSKRNGPPMQKRITSASNNDRPSTSGMQRLNNQMVADTSFEGDDAVDIFEEDVIEEDDNTDDDVDEEDVEDVEEELVIEEADSNKDKVANKYHTKPQKQQKQQHAPVELVTEFLATVMAKDFRNAARLCTQILLVEPNNKTAMDFSAVLKEKIQLEEEEDEEDSDDDDSDDDESDDNDDDDDDEGVHGSEKPVVTGDNDIGEDEEEEEEEDSAPKNYQSSGILLREDRMTVDDVRKFAPKKSK
eukprot:m.31666 g.31666  ORF g.31666 m.31666 type:complete len:244 (+) comp6323_c0_seq1:109-840(+)